ncbi:MAG: translation initiation factor IF-2 subunit alpha [Nanoarchaeota archaeon]|nr:translation initiation factor IF-2 subunit alpha [Nanoarchaeota archaeon]
MLFRKSGFPEESELIICTVTKVHPTSVFCNLDEYGKTGMIYISEVSPGRIRNLRDFVKEGKIIVCKVLQVRHDKGHIDLSLRRVTEGQKREKIDEMKQEQKSEKIIEFVAGKLKMDFKTLYDQVKEKVFPEHRALNPCFEAVANDNLSLEELGIPKKISDELTEIIKQRIKPPEVEIGGRLKLVSYAPDGVEIVKNVIKTSHTPNTGLKITYAGGGSYNISVISPDYKSAEKIMDDFINAAKKKMEAEEGIISFERAGNK